MTKTFDLTPTWRSIMPLLVYTAHNAETEEGRNIAMGELLKLADVVDAHIAELKTLRDTLPDTEDTAGIILAETSKPEERTDK